MEESQLAGFMVGKPPGLRDSGGDSENGPGFLRLEAKTLIFLPLEIGPPSHTPPLDN